MKNKMSTMWVMAAAVALIGSPALAQGRGPGGFGGFGGRGGGPSGLLRMEAVQKELKLDPAQVELLGQLQKEGDEKRRAMFSGFQDVPEDQRRARFEAMRPQMEKLAADQEKQANDILNAPQKTRLRQLYIQRSGVNAIAQKDVQDELKMNSDQRTKVEAIQKESGEAMRGLFNPGQGQRPSAEQFAELRKKMEDMRKSTDARLTAVLTAPQQAQFKTMQGAPFTFPEFGGFGGPGGQRRRPNQ